ncbi:flagellar biosynthesis protein FlhA [Thalassoroseus pseudoceratinae]|uniref:flagellar biosynthesis protein FlhA n=1 Tax=Thalassoroseus pseudoceratinae TaxID=2713176 RepID=UPI001424263C|nr:flagellar biosynthesis protein FlhA [Thalassoroseus pseudoceratinae]
MSSEATVGWRGFAAQQRGYLVPIFIISSVLILFAPLPPMVMDLLLACNVTLSVLILLTTIYVGKPLDFSVFPTILLGTTLARLVLNVASTRLILSGAENRGTAAAGQVIEAFGRFVSGDNVVVGVIIFTIIVVIQFVVITKGATRISEVTARFALDGMPGKQMAIDADLNAGLINSDEARSRREEVAEQADFYGAMDGASKFVRGDAVAGIIITLINIAGGLYVGMIQLDMDFGQAVEVFTTLTIGDGLVSQVPAFLVSLAAALIVTRTSSTSNLSHDVLSQVFGHAESLILSAAFLAILSVTGLPFVPLMCLSLACGLLGRQVLRGQATAEADSAENPDEPVDDTPQEPKLEDELTVPPLELELGVGLVPLADPNSEHDLTDRIKRVRQMLAQELGILLPNVRIRDNVLLNPNSYRIKLRDVPIAQAELQVEGYLAVDTGGVTAPVPGIDTVDPAFGREAKWIEPAYKDRAELFGYHVAEPSLVLTTHLLEVIRKHSNELLTRPLVYELLEHLKEQSPKLVEDLIPQPLSVPALHQVLRNLLRERIAIRDLETILTALGDYVSKTENLDVLTEYTRLALARSISQKYRDPNDGVLRVVTLEPGVENIFASALQSGDQGLRLDVAPQIAEAFIRALADQLQQFEIRGSHPVLVCGPAIRSGVKKLTEADLPSLAVLSTNEIMPDLDIEAVGQVALESLQGVAAASK